MGFFSYTTMQKAHHDRYDELFTIYNLAKNSS